jgi:REP element-mobilizing transposase RayT
MWQAAEFSGVEILTYCIMSNHFHVLVRVPCVKVEDISNSELVRRYGIMYPKPTVHQMMPVGVLEANLKAGGEAEMTQREQLLSRMHDISEFMKTLKQRFTIWYNKSNDRYGTFWAERYKSVLVDNKKMAKLIVAAYIDLNPVRAQIVSDPKDYRFSGYGESYGGSSLAQEGLSKVIEECPGHCESLAEYRMLLYSKGSAPDKSKGYRGGILSDEDAKEVLGKKKGQLSIGEALHCRVRYFTDGMILGEEDFLERIFVKYNESFGQKRTTGSRKMRGFDSCGLHVARDLRKRVISVR